VGEVDREARRLFRSPLLCPFPDSLFAPPSGLSWELIPILLQGCQLRRRCFSTTTQPGHLASSPSCKSHPDSESTDNLTGISAVAGLGGFGVTNLPMRSCNFQMEASIWLFCSMSN
jgi:hypothetical protein